MTDALAAAILGKLTSWYDFEGDLTDAHGSNNLTADVLSGFEPGKVGLSLKKGTRASANLSPIPISAGSGQFTIGGWFNYSQAVPEVNSFGLTTDTSVAQNEAFYVDNHAAGGNFALFGFTTAGVSWRVEDPNKPSIRYPITVQAVDADGRIAQSPQHIDIAANSGLTPGWYFVVGTFDNGLVKLYLNAALRTIGNASGTLKTPVVLVQIANRFTNTVSDAGLDSCFFSENAVMTIDEVAWLYNNGAGRNYAALQAASA